jgi:acylphosphatase
VEIVAQGPQHALDRLEAALAEGSRIARVDRVDVEALAALPADASWDVDF